MLGSGVGLRFIPRTHGYMESRIPKWAQSTCWFSSEKTLLLDFGLPYSRRLRPLTLVLYSH